jgi:hypothetical protein
MVCRFQASQNSLFYFYDVENVDVEPSSRYSLILIVHLRSSFHNSIITKILNCEKECVLSVTISQLKLSEADKIISCTQNDMIHMCTLYVSQATGGRHMLQFLSQHGSELTGKGNHPGSFKVKFVYK